MRKTVLLVSIYLAAMPAELCAQGYSGNSTDAGRQRDYAGKPCLQIQAISRAHIAAPRVYDHILNIENRCIQAIKAKVCYHKTEQCVDVNAVGRSRKEYLLGSFPAMSQFQFDIKEQPGSSIGRAR